MLRTRLESMIPAAYGQLAEFVGKFRKQIQATLPDTSVRRAFWEKELQGRFAELVYNGRLNEASTFTTGSDCQPTTFRRSLFSRCRARRS